MVGRKSVLIRNNSHRVKYVCGDPKFDGKTPRNWIICMELCTDDDGVDGVCLCVFKSTKAYCLHRLRWHEQREYQCRWCAFRTVKRSTMHDHEKKKHHKEKKVASRRELTRRARTEPTYAFELLDSLNDDSPTLDPPPVKLAVSRRKAHKRHAVKARVQPDDNQPQSNNFADNHESEHEDSSRILIRGPPTLVLVEDPSNDSEPEIKRRTLIDSSQCGKPKDSIDQPSLALVEDKDQNIVKQTNGTLLNVTNPTENTSQNATQLKSTAALTIREPILETEKSFIPIPEPDSETEESFVSIPEPDSGTEESLISESGPGEMAKGLAEIELPTSVIRKKLNLHLLASTAAELVEKVALSESHDSVEDGIEDRYNMMKEVVATLEAKVKEQAEKLQLSETEKSEYQNAMRQKLDKAQEEVQYLQSKNKTLENDIQAAVAENNSLKAQLSAQSTQIDNLKRCENVFQERVEKFERTLEIELVQLRESKSLAETQLSDLEQWKSNAQSDLLLLDGLKITVKELRENLKEAGAKAESDAEFKTHCEALILKVTDHEKKLEECHKQLEEKKTEVESLKKELSDLKKECDMWKSRALDTQKQCAMFQRKINNKQLVSVDKKDIVSIINLFSAVVPDDMQQSLSILHKLFICMASHSKMSTKMQADMRKLRELSPSKNYPHFPIPESKYPPALSVEERDLYNVLLYKYTEEPRHPNTGLLRPCFIDGENVARCYIKEVRHEYRVVDDKFGFRGIAKAVAFFSSKLGMPPSAIRVFLRTHQIYEDVSSQLSLRDNSDLLKMMNANIIEPCPSRVADFYELKDVNSDYDDVSLLLEARFKGGFVLSNDLFRDVYNSTGVWKLKKLRHVAEERRIGFRFTPDGTFDPFAGTKFEPDFIKKITFRKGSSEH